MSNQNIKFNPEHITTLAYYAENPSVMRGEFALHTDEIFADLYNAGFVKVEKDNHFVNYSLTDEGKKVIDDILNSEGISLNSLRTLAALRRFEELDDATQGRPFEVESYAGKHYGLTSLISYAIELCDKDLIDSDNLTSLTEKGRNLVDKYLGEFQNLNLVEKDYPKMASRASKGPR